MHEVFAVRPITYIYKTDRVSLHFMLTPEEDMQRVFCLVLLTGEEI